MPRRIGGDPLGLRWRVAPTCPQVVHFAFRRPTAHKPPRRHRRRGRSVPLPAGIPDRCHLIPGYAARRRPQLPRRMRTRLRDLALVSWSLSSPPTVAARPTTADFVRATTVGYAQHSTHGGGARELIERLRRLIHGPLAEVFDRLTTGALDRHCTVFDLRDPRAAQPDIPRLVAQVILQQLANRSPRLFPGPTRPSGGEVPPREPGGMG